MGDIALKPRKVGVGTFRATAKMRAYLADVLDSGRISYGPKSLEFETRFAQLHDCDFAVLSNSGTSALHVALQALKELHGWEGHYVVIVPATTFVATANIVYHNRLSLRFVDVDSRTYNLDPVLLEEAISPNTKAIIPVHLFGQPAQMDTITEIAKQHDLKIIEDSCETLGVAYRDKSVGAWGDIGCFSTYVAHLLVTGVGGMSTTNNPDYAAKMRSLVNHGLDLEFLNVGANFAPRPMPGRRFKFSSHGHSFRITELEAALGLAQMDTLRENLKLRARNARHLTAGLQNVNTHFGNPLQLPMQHESAGHAWMMYPIVLHKSEGQIVSKEPLMRFLNEHMIETRDMLPILDQPIYKWMDRTRFPVSDWLMQSGFYVGCHQDLTTDDIQYVIQTFEDYFDQ